MIKLAKKQRRSLLVAFLLTGRSSKLPFVCNTEIEANNNEKESKMSRIVILGNGSVELSAALALALSQNDIILCPDEIMSDPICINIPVAEDPVFLLSKRCNEWRGGSRKKGGKIGYRRI